MTENDQPVVVVKDLKKTFKLPHESHSGFKQIVTNAFKKNKKRGYEIQEVLKGVSFEVNRGDFFGIVGRNGSGKSTLLKLLAGIYSPDSGSVAINGSVVPFIELGVGFNPELTGRENVYMNGALLGFSHHEMDDMYDDIVSFAELERFMDQKLKNYSSGMQVRLAFSIAIKAQGDILILDEVLAVGDEAFQRKCNNYFEEIKKDKSKTIILVTHSMDSVRKYCNKALLIKQGAVLIQGSPYDVAREYTELNLQTSSAGVKLGGDIELKASFVDDTRRYTPDDSLDLKIYYKASNKNPIYAKVFVKYQGVVIMSSHSASIDKMFISADTKNHELTWRLGLNSFNKGEYSLEVLLQDANSEINLAHFGYEGELTFMVENTESRAGGAFNNQGVFEWNT